MKAAMLRGKRAFTLPHPDVSPMSASDMQPLIDEFWQPDPPTVLPAGFFPFRGCHPGHVSEGESFLDSPLRDASDF